MPIGNNKKEKKEKTGILQTRMERLGIGETTTTVAPPPNRLSRVAQEYGPIGLGNLADAAMDRRKMQEETPEDKRKKRIREIGGMGYGE
jgi:hypothetical protein